MLNPIFGATTVLASEAVSASAELQTAFQTAVQTIQTDVVGFVKIALPAGLVIMGLFLAIRLGIRFFKSIATAA